MKIIKYLADLLYVCNSLASQVQQALEFWSSDSLQQEWDQRVASQATLWSMPVVARLSDLDASTCFLQYSMTIESNLPVTLAFGQRDSVVGAIILSHVLDRLWFQCHRFSDLERLSIRALQVWFSYLLTFWSIDPTLFLIWL